MQEWSENPGSVSIWISRLHKEGDAAAEAIWRRFHKRLLELASRQLPDDARGCSDEEDIVNGAFHSFFRRLQEGEFAEVRDRDDLWRLLTAITRRKTVNLIRREATQKRRSARFDSDAPESPLEEYADVADLTPEAAAVHRETVIQLLGVLDDELRRIALAKMHGLTNQEIAAEIRRSIPTVERRLRLIRQTWEQVEEHSEG